MALVVNNQGGRGEETFQDESGGIVQTARVIVTNLPILEADVSFRRNPPWGTYGHFSISYAGEVVFFESWINFPDQAFYFSDTATFQNTAEQLDLPEGLYTTTDPNTILTVVKWQMRGDALVSIWLGT